MIQSSINSMISSVSSLLVMRSLRAKEPKEEPAPELSREEQIQQAADAKYEKQSFNAEVDKLVQARMKADEELRAKQEGIRETRKRRDFRMYMQDEPITFGPSGSQQKLKDMPIEFQRKVLNQYSSYERQKIMNERDKQREFRKK